MRSPTKQSVDAVVQAAIANLQDGRSVEDDSGIELKRDWPDPAKKARQLAAAANALRGDVLVYVIGADDKTGEITTPARREPQDWYAQVRKQFDQIAPEFLWCQTVFCGPDSASVQVLVFDTSEFPYVVKTAMNDILEVPYRRGTATRSARRSDLTRMFDPVTVVPRMEVTAAKVWVHWEDPANDPRAPYLRLSIDIDVYVEHSGSRPITLPVRKMRGRLQWDGFKTGFEVRVKHLGDTGHFPVIRRWGDPPIPETVPPQHGVYARANHVTATAPGEFEIRSEMIVPEDDPDCRSLLAWREAVGPEVSEVVLDLVVPVAGSSAVVRLSNHLVAHDFSRDEIERLVDERSQPLAMWELLDQQWDPWSETEDEN